MLIKCLVIGILILLFAQDMRWRAVYWWMYPVLLACLLADRLQAVASMDILRDGGWNLAFLGIQYLLLSVYFLIRKGRWIVLTRSYLGWGDILLLLCLCCYLPPLYVFLFYMLSLIVVLALSAIVISTRRHPGWKIPLAGLQALMLAMLLLWNLTGEGISLNHDEWLLMVLQR